MGRWGEGGAGTNPLKGRKISTDRGWEGSANED